MDLIARQHYDVSGAQMQGRSVTRQRHDAFAFKDGMDRRQASARQLQRPWRAQLTDAEEPAAKAQGIQDLRDQFRAGRTIGIVNRTFGRASRRMSPMGR